MNIEKTAAKNLLDIQAVSLQPNNPFTWASGIKSPVYCGNRLALSFPKERIVVVRGFVELVKQEYAEAKVIVGTATVSIPWGAMVADKLEKPSGYVHSSNKSHDKGNKIEGKIEQGTKVVVVEDLISTGGSVRDVIEPLREAGVEVLGVVAIFTYLLPASAELFHSISCEFETLDNCDVLIDMTLEHAYIKSGDLEKLKAWKQDPEDESQMEKQNREHNTLGHRIQQVFYAFLAGMAIVRTYRRSYMKKRLLILRDGSICKSYDLGAGHYQVGKFVFNTGMSGYRKVLSDLSYRGQIAMVTYPMVGNYRINRDDFESLDPAVFGFVVKEYCAQPNNFRCDLTLNEFLKLKEIPGICHVDTCAIIKKLHSSGTMRAIMANTDVDVDAVVRLLEETNFLHDQAAHVSTQKPFPIPAHGKKVVLMDSGTKHGIIRELSRRSCDLVVVPYNTSAQAIPALHPDGVMLSNGPGDPKDITDATKGIRELIERVPIFGACLGHQLISLACGANTARLKFGHHGCDHPALNLSSKKMEIASQNHGYVVEAKSLANTDLITAHQALNDKNAEGVRHKRYPIFSVQCHPEVAPGPEDTNYLFDQFTKLMEKESV